MCKSSSKFLSCARAATEFPISHLSEAAYPHHREKLRRLVIIIFNSNWLFHWGKSHWVSPICLRETRREWQQETRLDSYFVDFWYAGRALTHNVQDDPQLFKNPFKMGNESMLVQRVFSIGAAENVVMRMADLFLHPPRKSRRLIWGVRTTWQKTTGSLARPPYFGCEKFNNINISMCVKMF